MQFVFCMHTNRNAYTIQKEHAERAMKCNEEGFTTVEDVYNGLCRNDKDKSGKNVILHVEWVSCTTGVK